MRVLGAALIVLCSCRWGFESYVRPDAANPGPWRAVAIGSDAFDRAVAAAIDIDGRLWTWGNRRPIHLLGEATDWTKVAAGFDHACALRADGELWCWGHGEFGQLGTGALEAAEVVEPQRIGTARWIEIQASESVSCGIQVDGSLWCWGGADGLLGFDAVDNAPSPVQVGTQTGWHGLEMGSQAACAIDAENQVWCWGDNTSGFLGTGAATLQVAPALSTHAVGWRTLALGDEHFCGIDNSNRLWCVGEDAEGQLGDGRFELAEDPAQIAGQWRAIDAGAAHTCAIDLSNQGLCWGRNRSGALGDTTAPRHGVPVPSLGGHLVSAVSTSGDTTAWLTDDAHIAMIGSGTGGVLGDGPIDSTDLAPVEAMRWSSLALGVSHACGIAENGHVLCWGRSDDGQLADPSEFDRASPVEVLAEPSSTVSASRDYGLALDLNGHLWGWGDVPGLGASSPRQLDGAAWSHLGTSWSFACAIGPSGQLACMGSNTFGELGDGTTTGRSTLTPVAGALAARQWRKVALSLTFACALDTVGEIWCWGSNSAGGLGRGNISNGPHVAGQRIGGGQTYSDLGSLGDGTCALRNDGAVECWGYLLGGVQPTPQVIPGLTGVRMGTGTQHVCAIDAAGTMRCQGAPHSLMPPLTTATAIPGIWAEYIGGSRFGCARTGPSLDLGTPLHCWGSGRNGLYGDGRAWALSPRFVLLP
jgi:alpha-tubulin suppressor-like RCC1 family protein